MVLRLPAHTQQHTAAERWCTPTCLSLSKGTAERPHPDLPVSQVLHHQLGNRDGLAVDVLTLAAAASHHNHPVKQVQLKFLWMGATKT